MVKDGHLAFSPSLEEDQFGEASIDLRLGFSFTVLRNVPGIKISVSGGLGALSNCDLWRTKELKERDELDNVETFTIEPRQFVLAMTHEQVTVPRDMIAMVQGRSTYARVGLSMHQTAPWIQPGWQGQIALEIMNNGPLQVDLTPLKDRPCQLTFFRLSSSLPENMAYGAHEADVYQGQTHPFKNA